ncbi:MAG: tyrosine-type recombinase/integrase, partial [Kiritimatiellia bacterium]
TGRINVNPLQNADRVEVRGKERVTRRAFTNDEIIRLFQVAGPRKVVYLFAVVTGLRRGEMFALRWSDLAIDNMPFCVNVRSSTSKNHKNSVLPLRPELVVLLKGLRPLDYEPDARVFKGLMPEMNRFKKDLELAGIPFVDAAGRRADFHAMRKTLATNMLKGGVALRVAMEMMRHSEARLTAGVYTDASQLPLEDAINRLPSYAEPLAHILSQSLVRDGQNESFAVTKKIVAYHEQTPVDIAQGHDVASPVTMDMVARPAGFEPATL